MAEIRIPLAGGLSLAADEDGCPGSPPVLLFHGGGQTRHSWKDTVRELVASGFRTINVDLRGHGDSDWAADGDYSMDAIAEDVRAVARHVGQPVALVGASMGGIGALLAAGESPGADISALVLVDITPRVSSKGRQQVVEFMRGGLDGFESVEHAAAAVARYLPDRPAVSDSSGLMKNLRRSADGRLRWHWDPRLTDQRRVVEAERAGSRLEAAAAAVTSPMLLIRGGRSELVQADHVRDFLAVAPHAEYVEVARAGHMVAGDHNVAFSRAVCDFLCRQLEVKTPTG